MPADLARASTTDLLAELKRRMEARHPAQRCARSAVSSSSAVSVRSASQSALCPHVRSRLRRRTSSSWGRPAAARGRRRVSSTAEPDPDTAAPPIFHHCEGRRLRGPPTPRSSPGRCEEAHTAAALRQAPLIKDKYKLCHLATGDLLRAAVAAGAQCPFLRLGHPAQPLRARTSHTPARVALRTRGAGRPACRAANARTAQPPMGARECGATTRPLAAPLRTAPLRRPGHTPRGALRRPTDAARLHAQGRRWGRRPRR